MHPSRAVSSSLLRILIAISLLLGGLLAAQPPAGAVALTSGVLGGFEQDGNQTFDSSPMANLDWANSAPMVIVDTPSTGGGDTSIAGNDEAPLLLECAPTGGNTPAKANVQRAYIKARLVGNQVFLDLAWVREVTTGDTNVEFEFNQVETADPGVDFDGDCPITRTEGDLLITYDFSGNAAQDQVRLWRWDATNSEWDEMTTIVANAAVNAATIDDLVFDPSGDTDLVARRFGEATINLTAAFTPPGGPVACATFAQTRVRTRSNSQNFNGLSDRLPAVSSDISTCGGITIEKQDDQGNPVEGATFESFLDDGDGVFEPAGDDAPAVGTCVTDAAGHCTIDGLQPGDYFVREVSAPAGYTAAAGFVGPVSVGANQTVVINGLTDVTGDGILDGFVNFRTQWQLTLLEDARNLVGTQHTFTAHLTTSTDGGNTFVDAAGQSLNFSLSGQGSFVEILPPPMNGLDDCVTDADGECTATITSAIPGTTTVTATFTEAGVTVTEPVVKTDSGDKTWVDYRLTVSPSGVNRVGTAHTFTVLLETEEGNGFGPAAGQTVDLTWSGVADQIESINGAPAGNAPFSCTTDADGECEVVANSTVSGLFSLDASYDAVVGTTSRTIDADAATKRWIDWRLLISPDTASNLVDTEHTFTVTAWFDAGDGAGFAQLAGVHPDVTLSGVGSVVTDNCTTLGTDLNGQCTVVITSDEAGLSSASAVLDDTQLGVSTQLNAGPAAKQWVDYRLTVTPPTATHLINTTQQYVVTLEVSQSPFEPAAGEQLGLVLGGVGEILAIDGNAVVGNIQTCVTDAAGQCHVSVTSAVVGTQTLTASFEATVGPTSRTFTDSAEKNWEKPAYGQDPGDPYGEDPYGDDPGSGDPGDPYSPVTENPPADIPAVVSGETSERPTPVDPVVDPVVEPAQEAQDPPLGGLLPRTGAGLISQAFLALVLLGGGLTARRVARRRSAPEA